MSNFNVGISLRACQPLSRLIKSIIYQIYSNPPSDPVHNTKGEKEKIRSLLRYQVCQNIQLN